MSKSTKPKSNLDVTERILDGEEREYFVPSLGRSIKAVDQADIENQVKKSKADKPKETDGDS